jgi:hypothetical protein
MLQGVARCLRTGLALALGDASQSVVAYAPAAAAGVLNTYAAVFHNKSSWTWLAFLDVGAIWAVARRHKREHAEAAAAAIRGLMRDAEARWACCCGRVAAAAVVRRAAGQRVLQSQGGATLPLSCSRRHRVSRAARAEMERWSWRSATQQILQDHYPAAVAAAGGQPPPAVVPAAA